MLESTDISHKRTMRFPSKYQTDTHNGFDTTSFVSWTDYRYGQMNRNWKWLVSRGYGATTPLQGIERNITHSPASLAASATWNGWYDWQVSHSGRLNQSDTFPDPPLYTPGSVALRKAAGQFYQQARAAQTAFQGGEFLGEILKTARMIKTRALSAVNLLKPWEANRKKSMRTRSSVKDHMRDMGRAYLELKFGWDQLTRDVNGGINVLNQHYADFVNVRGDGSETTTSSIQFSTSQNGPMLYDNTVMTTWESSVRYQGAVRVYRVGNAGLLQGAGLMPSNWVPTLYNLLPWTWMIDYFTNLGSVVNAVCFNSADVTWAQQTVRNVATRRYQRGLGVRQNAGPFTKFKAQVSVPETTEYAVKTVLRNPAYVPVPSFGFSFPDLASEHGRTQALNVAAVLAARGLSQQSGSRYAGS